MQGATMKEAIGFLTFTDKDLRKIKEGSRTTILRSPHKHSKFYKGDGIYDTGTYQFVHITHRGVGKLAEFFNSSRSLAIKEGFESIADAIENAKDVKVRMFFAGKLRLHLYNIEFADGPS